MGDEPTLNETAEAFDLPVAKIRKLLIAGGKYDTALYRKINELLEDGLSLEEIADVVRKKAGTVKSYLNYEKVIYNLENRSKNAVRIQKFKERRKKQGITRHQS